MGLAAEIQWNLLPPLTFAGIEVSVAAALEPAYEVAGDSVDYAVDPDVARFAVFDGMGHELRSSHLVGLAVAAYRNARRRGRGLSQTAGDIDEAVTNTFHGEGFGRGTVRRQERHQNLLLQIGKVDNRVLEAEDPTMMSDVTRQIVRSQQVRASQERRNRRQRRCVHRSILPSCWLAP